MADLLSGQLQAYIGAMTSSLEYVKAGSLRALAAHIRRIDEHRHTKAEGPGGDQVDDKIEFRRLLDGQVGRFRAAQDQQDIQPSRGRGPSPALGQRHALVMTD